MAKLDIRATLLIALLARLVAFFLVPDPHFPDATTYEACGRSLMESGTMFSERYMPLYPLLGYFVGGGWKLQLLDILVSCVSVYVIYRLALELLKQESREIAERCALISALIWSVYPYSVFYSIARLTETTFVFLLVLAYLFLYRRGYLGAIVALVLSILIRPTLDLFAPALILIFSLFVHRDGIKRSVGRLAMYFGVYLVLMAPWWFVNYRMYGQFVRLNLGDGIVMYSGNNEINQSGGGVADPDPERNDMDLTQFDRYTNLVERNRAMNHAAVGFITNNPGRFIELFGVKFLRFWRLWPYAQQYLNWKTIVLSLASYGVVLAGFLAYAVRHGRRHFRRDVPIAALFGYLTLVHCITIGSIRYRFPLEPFMAVFAAYMFSQSRFCNKLLRRL